ncbi:uncharacterized protein PG986_009681 [Apiospora aurea]|uniref:Uncharacterized protein n=1 Tax=Apiospora aurea TaxID=335848 RepID=A0ABR1Q8F5_9PEZI
MIMTLSALIWDLLQHIDEDWRVTPLVCVVINLLRLVGFLLWLVNMAFWMGAAAGAVSALRWLDTDGLPRRPASSSTKAAKPSKKDPEEGGHSSVKRWTRKLKQRAKSSADSTEERGSLEKRIQALTEENGLLAEKNKTLQKANRNLLRQLKDQKPQAPPEYTAKGPENNQDDSPEDANPMGPNAHNLSPGQLTDLYSELSKKRSEALSEAREKLKEERAENRKAHDRRLQHITDTYRRGGEQYETYRRQYSEECRSGDEEYKKYQEAGKELLRNSEAYHKRLHAAYSKLRSEACKRRR